MNWSAWRAHFETNATRPLPQVAPPELPGPQRKALLQSLMKFQLGESGEGRVAHEIDRTLLPGIDDDYRIALKRFVAEESRHARILRTMVEALGGRILQHQWTERLFVALRRLFGIRFKLSVLQAAEVIGIGFYGLLAEVLPASELTGALGEICADEEQHLRFHRQFFEAQQQTVAGWVLRVAWWPLGAAAVTLVLWDHRATLRAFGVPLRVAAARLWAQVLRAAVGSVEIQLPAPRGHRHAGPLEGAGPQMRPNPPASTS